MKLKAILLTVSAFVAAVASAATSGSWMGAAKSLASSQVARLVAEYNEDYEDKDDKYDDETGTMWYKRKLTRGRAYTIWISGGNAANIDLDVDTDWDDENAPMAAFDIVEFNNGAIKAAYLYADEWDMEDDPSSGTYYVSLYGDIGASTMVYYQEGIKLFTQVGDPDSPKSLTFSTTSKNYTAKTIEDQYYITATLKAGCKYRVRTTNGTKSLPLSISIDSGDDDYSEIYADPAYTNRVYDEAYVIIPGAKAKYTFIVEGEGSQKFTFNYRQVPALPIADHRAYTLDASNNWTTNFVPGRISKSESYYDEIIDEHLCTLKLAAGDRVIFDAVGATNEVELIVYDTAGKVLSRNRSTGNGAFDVRAAISASKAGSYYVGVYDPNLGIYDTASGAPVTVTATWADEFAVADEWDPTDDTYSKATQIVAYPASTNDSVVTYGSKHGPHRFNGADWYDVYALPCRKGLWYTVASSFADSGDTTDLTLGYKLFTVVGGKEKQVAVTAFGDYGLEAGFQFKAATNAVHYLRVYVNEARSLDYPGHYIHATVSNGTNTLGLVKVCSTGVAGSFSFNSEKMSYPVGSTLALVAGTPTVKFGAVSGFTANPASEVITVTPWSEPSEERDPETEPVTEVWGHYFDKYDSYVKTSTVNKKTVKTTVTDDDMTGVVTIVATNSVKTYRRSLYANDPVDTFKFVSVAGWCYNLTLTDYVEGLAEGAVMTVSNSVSGVVVSNVTEMLRQPLPAGNNFVFVTHRDNAEIDSSYALQTSAANVGAVKFASRSYSAKDNAASVALVVKRTQKEGALRVRYTTVADTARPGVDYYQASGELSWAAGNKSDKTITIRLIPDLVAHWATNRVFTVKLWPVDESEFADKEYPATISIDTAKITLTEASAKKPGKVSISAYGEGEDLVAVSNIAKPVVSAEAGDDLVLTLSRTGGADGNIAVKLTTPVVKTDTAKAGIDFENLTTDNIVVWGDGDAENKQVTITTLPSSNYAASKNFTVKIAALTTGSYAGYDKPTLAAATATAKVLNDTVGKTSATFAKTVKGLGGITMAATGTWFVDHEGTLRSGTGTGTLTYTLTGPGYFAIEPSLDDGEGTDESTAKLVCSVDGVSIPCYGSNAVSRIERLLGAGVHVVKTTFSGGNGTEFATFANASAEEGALPFKWVRLAGVTVDEPMVKSVVTTNEAPVLRWSVPEDLAVENICTRVRFGTSKTPTGVIETDVDGESVVTNTLASGKTYYWALDFALADDERPDLTTLKWVPHPSVWYFSTLAAGAMESSLSGYDVKGESVADKLAAGEPIELIQTVKATMNLAGASANRYRLVAGKLPTGVTLNTTSGRLSGCPTAAGEFKALLQSYYQKSTKKNGKTTYTYKYGTTVPVLFNVSPVGTAAGTFRGALLEDGSELTKLAARTGLLTVSTTTAGKITATAKVAGNSYKFTGTGYDELTDEDPYAAGITREFEVRLKNITKVNKVAYTNYLTLVVGDGVSTNSVALAEQYAKATLTLNVPNNLIASATKVATKDVAYACELYRANGSSTFGKAVMTDFAGYYTVALVPTGVTAADGVPTGNGYLTVTVGATGSTSYAGVLADGTSVSGSTSAMLVGDDLDSPESCVLMIPFAWNNNSKGIGGVLRLVPATDDSDGVANVFDSASGLEWDRDGTSASRDGTGFTIDLAPTGGWYNKTVNIQTYYLNHDFTVEAAESDDLPTEALASGYSFVADSTPNELAVTFAGNKPSVAARKLVKDTYTKLYDLSKGVNPWSVTVSYTRSTGLLSGTFSCWTESSSAQKQITKLGHKGVMLFNRDASSPLPEDVWSAGYFLMPATSKWTCSLPFNIIATPVDRDWTEMEVPEQ